MKIIFREESMNLFIIFMLNHCDEVEKKKKLLAHFPRLTYTPTKFIFKLVNDVKISSF